MGTYNPNPAHIHTFGMIYNESKIRPSKNTKILIYIELSEWPV